jgi:hypothetical protein
VAAIDRTWFRWLAGSLPLPLADRVFRNLGLAVLAAVLAFNIGTYSYYRGSVLTVDYPDGRLSIRYRGVELAYRTFDKIRQVDQAAIVDNKQLGPVFAMIRDEQLRRGPRMQWTQTVHDEIRRIAGVPATTANHSIFAARSTANLRKLQIAAAIEKAQNKRAERAELTGEMVVDELRNIAFANMADYVPVAVSDDPHGDFRGLGRDLTAAVVELVVDKFVDGRGEDARAIRARRVCRAA